MVLFIGFYFCLVGFYGFFQGVQKGVQGIYSSPLPSVQPPPPEGPYDKLQTALRELGFHFGLRVFRPGYSMAGKERFKPFGELN